MNGINPGFIKKMLARGAFKFTINGNSMEPRFFHGDTVKIASCPEYRVDDIVLYESGTRLVAHRIMDMRGELVITKGDHNSFMDHGIKRSAILGKIVDHNPVAPQARAAVFFNFWNEALYHECKPCCETLNLQMTLMENRFFEDGKNIAISAASPVSIMDMEKIAPEHRLYIHIGVPIADHHCEGFVHKDRFDGVYRSGTYTSSYLLTHRENFLVLYGELMAYWNVSQ
jgi:signal peptidase I